jgi:hypothetical protein
MPNHKSSDPMPQPGHSQQTKGSTSDRELLFVPYVTTNVSETGQRDELSIRQHVMHDFHRKKKRNQLQRLSNSVDLPPSTPFGAQLSRFKLERPKLKISRGQKAIAPSNPVQKLKIRVVTDRFHSEPDKTAHTSELHPRKSGYLVTSETQIQSSIQDILSSFKRDPFIEFPVSANDEVNSLFMYCKGSRSDSQLMPFLSS